MNRRTVLRGIGASVGTAGVAGIAGATSRDDAALSTRERASLEREYSAPETAKTALREVGAPILAALEDRGLYEEGVLTGSDAEPTVFAHAEGETPTAHLVHEYEMDGRQVEVHVLPEAGRSLALVSRRSDSDATLRLHADPDGSVREGGQNVMGEGWYETVCHEDGCSGMGPTNRYNVFRCSYGTWGKTCERIYTTCGCPD
jgi:hypothetical protein